MPVDAEVIPINEKWTRARKAKVILKDPDQPDKAYENVDIINIPWTPASIVIDKNKYPNGVVIFNEEESPDDQRVAKTKEKDTFNLTLSGANIAPVVIRGNSGWPSGEIILW